MQASYPSRQFILITFVLMLVNAIFFYSILDPENIDFQMSEEGLLEQVQNVYLALAAVAFLIGGLRHHAEKRMFYIAMSWLMVLFFFREMVVEPHGPISSYIHSHQFRWHEAIVTVIFAAIYVWRCPSYVKPVMQYVLSPKCWPYYFAAFLLVMGEVFERQTQWYYNQFFEELSECLGYVILLVLGVCSILSAKAQHNN
ncbi:hypothetical protein ACI0FM_04240 [Paenochrobactrum sp. BZR 588]|uniref:hypothetical protein n=1 Tax=Paenochrobactrum TaxID=999488 RepID=UPI0035BC840C